jgi:hypothetical protein
MWLDVVDRARLINLDYVQSISLERESGDGRWMLNAVSHSGAVESITSYKDPGEAARALDRIRHALQTIVLSSDGPARRDSIV